MSDAFSRRGFGGLLLTGGAGLLLGVCPEPAEARRGSIPRVEGRFACRLDENGLVAQLHLRSRTPQRALLPRRLIVLSGVFLVDGTRHSLASVSDSLPNPGIQSRAGGVRPTAVALSQEEVHYASFRWPVPPGLEGSGRGDLRLRVSPADPANRPRSPLQRELLRLSLRERVRFTL